MGWGLVFGGDSSLCMKLMSGLCLVLKLRLHEAVLVCVLSHLYSLSYGAKPSQYWVAYLLATGYSLHVMPSGNVAATIFKCVEFLSHPQDLSSDHIVE